MSYEDPNSEQRLFAPFIYLVASPKCSIDAHRSIRVCLYPPGQPDDSFRVGLGTEQKGAEVDPCTECSLVFTGTVYSYLWIILDFLYTNCLLIYLNHLYTNCLLIYLDHLYTNCLLISLDHFGVFLSCMDHLWIMYLIIYAGTFNIPTSYQ